jgi:1-acyl-sn-glycerol-3-phosphate acyltransferase
MLSDAFRSFMGYISNIFYRDLTIIDEDNLPQDEAVIVYGNHSNVFVDGMVIFF